MSSRTTRAFWRCFDAHDLADQKWPVGTRAEARGEDQGDGEDGNFIGPNSLARVTATGKPLKSIDADRLENVTRRCGKSLINNAKTG